MTSSDAYIAEHLHSVLDNIAMLEQENGRIPGSIVCLAVSKGQPFTAIEAAYGAGQRHFAENYSREALKKMQSLSHYQDICWHFIGPVQKNKTKDVAQNFQWLHSLDRLIIAERLNEQRDSQLPPLNVCIQVNITSETSKSGVRPERLLSLAKTVSTMPNLQLRGLMTIASENAEQSVLRTTFKTLRQLKEELVQQMTIGLDTLSMGMSKDYPHAIAEGATIVRIGTAIFGPRN